MAGQPSPAKRREPAARPEPLEAPEPPAHIPYFGAWSDNKEIFATNAGQRIKLDADKLQGVFMPNPQDVRIAELEEEVSALRARLEGLMARAAE